MLAGIVLKLGIFGVLRYLFIYNVYLIFIISIILGCSLIGIYISSIGLLFTEDIKKLIAFLLTQINLTLVFFFFKYVNAILFYNWISWFGLLSALSLVV